jgi:hypothetical protein
VPLHELHCLLQLVRNVEIEEFYALQISLGDAGQRARRRHLEHSGDSQVTHRGHAKIPTYRRSDLAHQALEHLATIVHDLPVGVR